MSPILLRTMSNSQNLRHNIVLHEDIIDIDRQKIVPLFDVPHLLKGFRNTLMKHDIKYVEDGIDKLAT